MKVAKVSIEISTEEGVSSAELVVPEDQKYWIGRKSKDLKLNFESISSLHACFLLKDTALTLIDNKSLNATKVNGIEVDQILIEVTDILQFGSVAIEIKKIHIDEVDPDEFEQSQEESFHRSGLEPEEIPQYFKLFYKNPKRFFNQLPLDLDARLPFVGLILLSVIIAFPLLVLGGAYSPIGHIVQASQLLLGALVSAYVISYIAGYLGWNTKVSELLSFFWFVFFVLLPFFLIAIFFKPIWFLIIPISLLATIWGMHQSFEISIVKSLVLILIALLASDFVTSSLDELKYNVVKSAQTKEELKSQKEEVIRDFEKRGQ